MLSVEAAEYIEGYKLRVTFIDGKTGIADLERMVHEDRRPIFAALKDLSLFKDFRIDFNTLCWSNSLDLAPEFLYFLAFHDDPDLQTQFAEWGYSSAAVLARV